MVKHLLKNLLKAKIFWCQIRSTLEYYLPQMSLLQLVPPPVDSSDPHQPQTALPIL